MLCNHDYPTIPLFIHGHFHFLIATHELQKILGRWGSSSHYFHGVFDGQGLLLFCHSCRHPDYMLPLPIAIHSLSSALP
jgi:hypothetical protein